MPFPPIQTYILADNTIDISRHVKMFRSVIDSKRSGTERDLVVNVVAVKR